MAKLLILLTIGLVLVSLGPPGADAFIEGIYCGKENCYDGKTFVLVYENF